MSPKKMRKKGNTAPAAIADKLPTISFIFSGPVVYLNREKNGAGGIFFSYFYSLISDVEVTSFSYSVSSTSFISERDSFLISNLIKLNRFISDV